ncbi:MAG: hypothetical protein LC725_05370 [Lentisphaerae bacterium]|nr:hypothetical protein [Lentisphaerota bacterium]
MRTIQKHSFSEASGRTAMTGRILKVLITAVLVTIVQSVYGAEDSAGRDNAREERNRLVETVRSNGAVALPALQLAITSEYDVVRYTAAHLLVHLGEAAYETLVSNLSNDDVQVRYVVLGALEDLGVAGDYVEELVMDESAVIRRRFYLDVMPTHLLVDGAPPEELIASLASAYDAGTEQIRHEIIKAVADLQLTEASTALIRRAADRSAAVVAAEGDKSEIGQVEKKALVAYLTLQEIEIEKMRALTGARQWQQLIDEFGDRDIGSWPVTSGSGRMVSGLGHAGISAEAYYRLGQAFCELGQGEKAEQMLRTLIEQVNLGIGHAREREFYRRILALYKENYQKNLPDDEKVRDRYVHMQFDYGNQLAQAGREDEAQASFAEVLKVEGLDAGVEEEVNKAVAKLEKK